MTGVWYVFVRRAGESMFDEVDFGGNIEAEDGEFNEYITAMEGVDVVRVVSMLVDRLSSGDDIRIECDLAESSDSASARRIFDSARLEE